MKKLLALWLYIFYKKGVFSHVCGYWKVRVTNKIHILICCKHHVYKYHQTEILLKLLSSFEIKGDYYVK